MCKDIGETTVTHTHSLWTSELWSLRLAILEVMDSWKACAGRWFCSFSAGGSTKTSSRPWLWNLLWRRAIGTQIFFPTFLWDLQRQPQWQQGLGELPEVAACIQSRKQLLNQHVVSTKLCKPLLVDSSSWASSNAEDLRPSILCYPVNVIPYSGAKM